MSQEASKERDYRITFTIPIDVRAVEEPIDGADAYEWEIEAISQAIELLKDEVEGDVESYVTNVRRLNYKQPKTTKRNKKR